MRKGICHVKAKKFPDVKYVGNAAIIMEFKVHDAFLASGRPDWKLEIL